MGNTISNLCKKKLQNPNNSTKRSFLSKNGINNQKQNNFSKADEESSLLSNENNFYQNDDDIESQQQQQKEQTVEDYSNLNINQEIKIKYPIQLSLIIKNAEIEFLETLKKCQEYVVNLEVLEKSYKKNKDVDFSDYQNVFKSTDKKYPELNIYLKSYQQEKNKITNFYYTWELQGQTDLQKIFDFFNNIEISKKIDKNMNTYEIIENINDQDQILYLLYKKVLIASPRDFLYIKRKQINLAKKEAYFVTRSIQLQNKDELDKKVRGEIILSGTYFKQNLEKNCIEISVISDVDAKLSLPLAMTKPAAVNQIKKMVQATTEQALLI